MTSIRLILKHKGKWSPVDLPPVDKLTSAQLSAWNGKECRIEYISGDKTIYVYGNAAAMWPESEGKVTMDIPSFCHFWEYNTFLEGTDVFLKTKPVATQSDEPNLLNQFAMYALMGQCAGMSSGSEFLPITEWDHKTIAKGCYMMARAMMEEKSK